ncbi:hypothetical protein NLJ89_g7438 [Agrocybe chaxingu]|uniref:Uncharacterized protein n=1 Tax=Agrocybe chaxingu TaxID=84603 RepID=A0A9W8JXC6_9AGAR|nr:hypothetical protein NLJ89_g7438 [Agrocybe chaxingu]
MASLQATDAHDGRQPDLHALLVKLTRDGSTRHDVRESIKVLRKISTGAFQLQDVNGVEDSEEAALEAAVVGKLTVALYADALDVYIRQATQVEAESEWWSDVENSRISLGLYLVQTLPARLVRVFKTIIETLQQRQLSVTFSSLSPASIRALFPSPSHFTLKPGLLTTALFPHIRHQPTLSLAILFPASTLQSLSREDSCTKRLEALAEKVHMGELALVMQVYEEDIRTPLCSALTDTLLRNTFIQVQKAKVDIDQALSGIDRLLKSQELTFAFVGVTPALAVP